MKAKIYILLIILSTLGLTLNANKANVSPDEQIEEAISFPKGQAITSSMLFSQGVEAYTHGDFYQAINFFKKLEDEKKAIGLESPELYYDLANAYYQVNNYGYARLYYEKALLLKPDYENAQHNVKVLQNKLEDKVYSGRHFFRNNVYLAVQQLFTSNVWNSIGIGSFLIFLAMVGLFFLFDTENKKKLVFYIGVFGAIICIFANIFAFQQGRQIIYRNGAVVVDAIAKIYKAPNTDEPEIAILYEGAKIKVVKDDKNWKEIEMNDGTKGWIENAKIAII